MAMVFASCNTRAINPGRANFSIKIPKSWKPAKNNLFGDKLEEIFGEEIDAGVYQATYVDKETETSGIFISVMEIPSEFQGYSTGTLLKELGLSQGLKKLTIDKKDIYVAVDRYGFDGITAGAFLIEKKLFYAFLVMGDGENAQYVEQIIRTIRFNKNGLFAGIWDGFKSPFSLVKSIFSKDTKVYASANNGFQYLAGFIIGVILLFLVIGGVTNNSNNKNAQENKAA
jgi:hypothetical protein